MNLMLTQGNALLIPLADESVHCVVTSPPYWGLRDYGIGDQLGLEPTPEQYVENMVEVFREVKRVLRADGTLWLNMGDSYASGGSKAQSNDAHDGGVWKDDKHKDGFRNSPKYQGQSSPNTAVGGLKVKDLCGIPWRLAFALQADGWWLRSDIIWSKPNPMPESVTDRPTKAHEYLFLLTKSARYYYDADAVRVKGAGNKWGKYSNPKYGAGTGGKMQSAKEMTKDEYIEKYQYANRRTVWHIATAPYSGAHFATYPPALVEPCIKAGTSERGVCPECGAPWERVVELTPEYKAILDSGKAWRDASGKPDSYTNRHPKDHPSQVPTKNITTGWRPTCECSTSNLRDIPHDPIPATVFDPFVGSGTSLQEARRLGRNGVGLDLSLEYLHLARERLSLDALDAWGEAKKEVVELLMGDLPMFGGQDER